MMLNGSIRSALPRWRRATMGYGGLPERNPVRPPSNRQPETTRKVSPRSLRRLNAGKQSIAKTVGMIPREARAEVVELAEAQGAYVCWCASQRPF